MFPALLVVLTTLTGVVPTGGSRCEVDLSAVRAAIDRTQTASVTFYNSLPFPVLVYRAAASHEHLQYRFTVTSRVTTTETHVYLGTVFVATNSRHVVYLLDDQCVHTVRTAGAYSLTVKDFPQHTADTTPTSETVSHTDTVVTGPPVNTPVLTQWPNVTSISPMVFQPTGSTFQDSRNTSTSMLPITADSLLEREVTTERSNNQTEDMFNASISMEALVNSNKTHSKSNDTETNGTLTEVYDNNSHDNYSVTDSKVTDYFTSGVNDVPDPSTHGSASTHIGDQCICSCRSVYTNGTHINTTSRSINTRFDPEEAPGAPALGVACILVCFSPLTLLLYLDLTNMARDYRVGRRRVRAALTRCCTHKSRQCDITLTDVVITVNGETRVV